MRNLPKRCKKNQATMGKGKLKGGKGQLSMPRDMTVSGPLKKVKKPKKMSRKQRQKKEKAAERGENWAERKQVHSAKLAKKTEKAKGAKKTWQ